MQDKKELRKANGDVYFEAIRMSDSSFIHVKWIGIQSLETIVMGGNHVLAMLKEIPCQGLLNCNRELIGPWDAGIPYLVYKWAPAAHLLGLRYFGHVLSPGIYGQKSFEQFKAYLKTNTPLVPFQIKAFEEENTAKSWLLLHLS